MYTFSITDNPPMCTVYNDSEVYDLSGPWESVESAQSWAQEFVDKLNGDVQ